MTSTSSETVPYHRKKQSVSDVSVHTSHSTTGVIIWNQPKQYIVTGEIPQNCHCCAFLEPYFHLYFWSSTPQNKAFSQPKQWVTWVMFFFLQVLGPISMTSPSRSLGNAGTLWDGGPLISNSIYLEILPRDPGMVPYPLFWRLNPHLSSFWHHFKGFLGRHFKGYLPGVPSQFHWYTPYIVGISWVYPLWKDSNREVKQLGATIFAICNLLSKSHIRLPCRTRT